MQLGLIGLGRMGGNMAERLRLGGHQVVGFDFNADAVAKLTASGNIGVSSLEDLVRGCGVKYLRVVNPYEIKAMIQEAKKAYERLTIEAALSGDHNTALRALMSNPLVGEWSVAVPLLAALLDANRAHLPRFFPAARD